MTSTLILVAGADDTGLRLDRFLQKHVVGHSRTQLSKLLVSGSVTLVPEPSRAVAPSTKVVAGTRVTVEFPPPEPSALTPWDVPLPVLVELPELVVLDKPPGLVVHPGAGHRDHTLAHALLARYPEVAAAGSGSRPGIVHRLDRATSGVLVVARSHEAYLSLVAQFSRRLVEKRYLALVAGRPSPASGSVDAPIGRDPRERQRFSTRAHRAKPALSHYRTLATSGRFSELEVRIETGRTHQIRVHMSALGHPLVGDRLYGNAGRYLPEEAKALAASRGGAFLHAARLRFHRPLSGEPLEVDAPVPEDYRGLKQVLGV